MKPLVRNRRWIAPGLLPRGDIVLLAADTNTGKSPLAYHWIACITAGKDFAYDLPVTGKRSGIILFSGEGDLARDVNPRLVAAGVELAHLTVFDCVTEHSALTLADIADIVRRHSDVALVVVDPLTAFVNTNTSSPYRVRQLLAPFHKLAADRGVTFLFVHHTVKSRTARNPLGLISGSKAWTDNAPYVWQIEPCNADGQAVLELTKGRGVARPFPAFEFWIEAIPVAGLREPLPVAVVGDRSEITIRGLMENRLPNLSLSATDRALTWLRTFLSEGPRLVSEIEADGKEAGNSLPTLRRAKKAGGIEDRKRTGDGRSEWFLTDDQVEQLDQVAQLDLATKKPTLH